MRRQPVDHVHQRHARFWQHDLAVDGGQHTDLADVEPRKQLGAHEEIRRWQRPRLDVVRERDVLLKNRTGDSHEGS
jgi:hypothetical protein